MKIRTAAVAAIILASAGVLATALPASASWYPAQVSTIGAGATVRDCYHPVQWPSTNCPAVKFLPKGTAVHIICQRVGDLVYGTYGSSEVWDYVSVTVSGQTYEGLVADVNVYTGSNGLVADVCS